MSPKTQTGSGIDFSLCSFEITWTELCHWHNAQTKVYATYCPPKISQSPWEVPMNSSIGSDSHAFVREAMKA